MNIICLNNHQNINKLNNLALLLDFKLINWISCVIYKIYDLKEDKIISKYYFNFIFSYLNYNDEISKITIEY
jgi:hypothetical protein